MNNTKLNNKIKNGKVEQAKENSCSKIIFLSSLSIMKDILTMGEYKYGGRNSSQYKYFKASVMDIVYRRLRDLYSKLEKIGIVEKCDCNNDLKNGYGDCDKCAGSGYKDV